MTDPPFQYDASDPPAELKLAKSGLRLAGGVLVRQTEDGAVTTQLPVAEIVQAEVSSRIETISVVFTALCIAMAVLAMIYIPYPGWGYAAGAVLFAGALFWLFASYAPLLIVQTEHGDIRFPLMDEQQDCEGFAVALNRQRKEAASHANDKAAL